MLARPFANVTGLLAKVLGHAVRKCTSLSQAFGCLAGFSAMATGQCQPLACIETTSPNFNAQLAACEWLISKTKYSLLSVCFMVGCILLMWI